MASKPETPQKKETEEEKKKIEHSSSDEDNGPLDEESSDPDIDSSDQICTKQVSLCFERGSMQNFDFERPLTWLRVFVVICAVSGIFCIDYASMSVN